MTKQEIFNKVWHHFIVLGAPKSVDEDNSCVYRGPNGARCAIGVIFPDDEYTPVLDEKGGSIMVLASALRRGRANGIDMGDIPPTLRGLLQIWGMDDYLSALQRAHDEWHEENGAPDLRRRLIKVAEGHSLVVPA